MSQLPPFRPPTHRYATPQSSPSSSLAVASMVLGIVGLVLFCVIYVSAPCAILAVILGFVARSKVKSGEGAGGGMALAGIICGFTSLLLYVLLMVGLFSLIRVAQPAFQKALQQQQQLIQQQQQQQQQRQQQQNSSAPSSAGG